jgi:hypothetical protein
VLYSWVYNHTRGSILIAMLMHAASNRSSAWLTRLLQETRLAPPESGWLGYIAAHQWLNVIAFGMAALRIVATRGRLGYRPVTGLALPCATGWLAVRERESSRKRWADAHIRWRSPNVGSLA